MNIQNSHTFFLINQANPENEVTVIKGHTVPLILEASFDISKANLKAKLMYQTKEPTEVHYLKSTPLEYKGIAFDNFVLNSLVYCDKFGRRATIDARIKVLSSQVHIIYILTIA